MFILFQSFYLSLVFYYRWLYNTVHTPARASTYTDFSQFIIFFNSRAISDSYFSFMLPVLSTSHETEDDIILFPAFFFRAMAGNCLGRGSLRTVPQNMAAVAGWIVARFQNRDKAASTTTFFLCKQRSSLHNCLSTEEKLKRPRLSNPIRSRTAS